VQTKRNGVEYIMPLTKAELESMMGKTMQLTLKLFEKQLAINDTMEFLIFETLKLQALYLKDNKRTPYKRIEALEENMKGMNAYYQEQLAELRHHPTPPLKRDFV